MTISYSPTANSASTRTSGAAAAALALTIGDGAAAVWTLSNAIPRRRGWSQGSCSQYWTSRGALSRSRRSKTPAGRVLTFSFWRTTGTGTTMAKRSGGPL